MGLDSSGSTEITAPQSFSNRCLNDLLRVHLVSTGMARGIHCLLSASFLTWFPEFQQALSRGNGLHLNHRIEGIDLGDPCHE